MKTVTKEDWRWRAEINEPPRLLLIEAQDTDNYKEVVFEKGNDIVDIIYEEQPALAKHDLDNIKTTLINCGYNEAKQLADYYKMTRK